MGVGRTNCPIEKLIFRIIEIKRLKGMRDMKGAIVFLVVFAIAVVITLGNTSIPPGKAIYDTFLPNTEAASGYLIGGSIDAVTAIISVFNGVIYGFVAWLVFTLATMGRKKQPQNIQQVVNVNVGDKKDTAPPSPNVPRFLEGKKLNAPKWPIEPTFLPLYFAPWACAQSSMTHR